MSPPLGAAEWTQGDPQLARALTAALAAGEPERLAESAHRRALRVVIAGRPVLVKQFRVGSGRHPWRERAKAAIGRAPADREWRALAAAHAAGLPVPEPLALGVLPSGDRLLAMGWIDGAPLPDALRTASPRARRDLLHALGVLLARVHATGWVHGDLHPGNLLSGEAGVVLLDWQRARRSRSARGRARDLARLEHGLAPLVPRTARLRLRAAALGVARPFDAAARRALRAAGDAADRRPMVIVGFQGMRDFYPHLIARNLAAQGQSVRAAMLPWSVLSEQRDRNSVQLAEAVDDPRTQQRLIVDTLPTRSAAENATVNVPSCVSPTAPSAGSPCAPFRRRVDVVL